MKFIERVPVAFMMKFRSPIDPPAKKTHRAEKRLRTKCRGKTSIDTRIEVLSKARTLFSH